MSKVSLAIGLAKEFVLPWVMKPKEDKVPAPASVKGTIKELRHELSTNHDFSLRRSAVAAIASALIMLGTDAGFWSGESSNCLNHVADEAIEKHVNP